MQPDTVLRRQEIERFSGATKNIIEHLVVCGAVRPAIRGKRRIGHAFDAAGWGAIHVYMWLRTLDVEGSICRDAARLAQEAGYRMQALTDEGRTYLLVLPAGVAAEVCTRDEAKVALAGLADVDLGRAIVVNLLPIWRQVEERVREVLAERERGE